MAMEMPLITGLLEPDSGEQQPEPDHGPGALAQWLDSLADEQVQALEEAAASAPPAEDDAETSEEQPAEGEEETDDAEAEASETAEEELAESPEEQEQEQADGVEDLSSITDQVASDIEEGQGVVKQLEKLAADTESEHAVDAKKLAKQASKLLDQMTRAQKAALKAAKSEDAHECAQAGVDAHGLLEAMQSLLVAAQAMGAKTTLEEPTLADHPSIKQWAARVKQKQSAPALG